MVAVLVRQAPLRHRLCGAWVGGHRGAPGDSRKRQWRIYRSRSRSKSSAVRSGAIRGVAVLVRHRLCRTWVGVATEELLGTLQRQ